MAIYQDYAPFYDGSGQIRFAVLTGQYLREVLVQHPVAGRRALDLACGTGTLACILADNGWDVVGLDSSVSMLDLARARALDDAPGQMHFIEGDIRDLPRAEGQNKEQRTQNKPKATTAGDESGGRWSVVGGRWSFNLVTCTYDSLNYLLTEADLARCFAGVARALLPGGVFFADMNTIHFLEHDWPAAEVLERPSFVQVSQSWFDPATACSTMVLTGFAGDDAQGYRRFDEIHVERGYRPEVVAALLADAGLVVEAAYDCFTFQPMHDLSQRIAWIARKPERVSG
jgi:SAM-dependent methyltransferase